MHAFYGYMAMSAPNLRANQSLDERLCKSTRVRVMERVAATGAMRSHTAALPAVATRAAHLSADLPQRERRAARRRPACRLAHSARAAHSLRFHVVALRAPPAAAATCTRQRGAGFGKSTSRPGFAPPGERASAAAARIARSPMGRRSASSGWQRAPRERGSSSSRRRATRARSREF